MMTNEPQDIFNPNDSYYSNSPKKKSSMMVNNTLLQFITIALGVCVGIVVGGLLALKPIFRGELQRALTISGMDPRGQPVKLDYTSAAVQHDALLRTYLTDLAKFVETTCKDGDGTLTNESLSPENP